MPTPEETMKLHLHLRSVGHTSDDVNQNYTPDCLIISNEGILHGHTGVHKSAQTLSEIVPDATFSYTCVIVEQNAAFLEWKAQSPHGVVCDGVDSFFFKDGLIAVQTIHYTLREE